MTTETTTETVPARRRARDRQPPRRSAEFGHLTLEEVREYRQQLTTEETRVSYWRRIVQGRLDLLRAGEEGLAADIERLGKVLTDAPSVSRRRVLVEVVPFDDIPPLPDLDAVWHRVVSDPAQSDHAIGALEAAEHELSTYRNALHRRIQTATDELVARYREQPHLCLTLLPTQRGLAESA